MSQRPYYIIIIILGLTLLRLYPVINTNACISSDCLRYFAYAEGLVYTPEVLFLGISRSLFLLGIDPFVINAFFMLFIPAIFSFGVYLYLKDKVNFSTLIISVVLSNTLLSLNLFYFVLLKNGLMIMFFPFMLYFYERKEYVQSMIFMLFLSLSHMTFAILAIPIMIDSFKKNKVVFAYILLLLLLFVPYYYLNQGYIFDQGNSLNLNYMFADIPILFFAVLSKRGLMKNILIFVAILSAIALAITPEAWRIIMMINIPALFLSTEYVDGKSMRYVLYFYAIISFVLWIILMMSFQNYLVSSL